MPPALLLAVREFAEAILDPYDAQELLYRVTQHAVSVADAAGAGIMLTDSAQGLGFAAASHESVTELEQLQSVTERGPCHEAYTTNQVVVVDDLRATDRWPRYRARALENGFSAILGVPMSACGRTIGVLNIYRTVSRPWMRCEIDAAEILATMGAGYILHGHHLATQRQLAEQLHTALQSRDVIGQAKGILMARHRVGPDEAFELLRGMSQSANRKLRDVAAHVVTSHRMASSGR
jgi:GAF domain-containing protein